MVMALSLPSHALGCARQPQQVTLPVGPEESTAQLLPGTSWARERVSAAGTDTNACVTPAVRMARVVSCLCFLWATFGDRQAPGAPEVSVPRARCTRLWAWGHLSFKQLEPTAATFRPSAHVEPPRSSPAPRKCSQTPAKWEESCEHPLTHRWNLSHVPL